MPVTSAARSIVISPSTRYRVFSIDTASRVLVMTGLPQKGATIVAYDRRQFAHSRLADGVGLARRARENRRAGFDRSASGRKGGLVTSTTLGGGNAVDARRRGGGQDKLWMGTASSRRFQISWNRRFRRSVDVGPKLFFWNFSLVRKLERMLSGNRCSSIEPPPNRGLRYPKKACGGRLRTDSRNCRLQGLQGIGMLAHNA